MANVGVQLAKIFASATIPALIHELFTEKRLKKKQTLEELQDCIDWDAEYEQLLKKHDKETKKQAKASKKRKARK